MGHKVSRGFKSYTDAKIVTFASTIYERMSSDNQYITLKPFVDDVKVKKDALVTGIALAVRKDQDRRDEKNAFKIALINLLDKIAHKIEDLVEERENNSRVITDAGFEVRNTTKKEKEPVTELDMPVFIAKDVDKKAGWASLTWGKVLHALTYAIRHRKKSETVWQNGNYNDKGEFTFTNLEPDNVYEFEICALGPDGISSGWTGATPIYVS